MTAIAHFVLDDFALSTLKSRIGALSGALIGASNPLTDSYMDRKPHSTPAKVMEGDSVSFDFFVSGQTIDNAILPVPVTSPIRSYEMIVKGNDLTAVQLDGTGGFCSVAFTPSNICTIEIDNASDGIGLSIGSNPWVAGTYQHVVVVLDFSASDRKAKLYMDGVLVGQDHGTLDLSSWQAPLYTGDLDILQVANDHGSAGLCEMMVHDVELTALEIQQRSFNMRAINAQR